MTDEKTNDKPKTAAEEQAALPAGFRIEPKKTVTILKPTVVDGKDAAVGSSQELDANIANILIGDGTAEDPEAKKKAEEGAAQTPAGEGEPTTTSHRHRR